MQLDERNIKDRVAAFLKIPVDRMQDDMPIKSLIPDSFMLVELMIQLEEDYGIRLDQEVFGNVHTVSDLTRLIGARSR